MGDWLWLDDLRPPPKGYRYWATTYAQAIIYLDSCVITHCSLDHDLAEEHYASARLTPEAVIERRVYREPTGYEVLVWMHETGKWCPDITIHTLNTAARRDMERLIERHAPRHVVWRVGFAPMDPSEPRDES